MRLILASLAIVMATTSSQAISRYNIGGKSCGEVQSIIAREGAAILRYTSKRGLPLYDRYVAASRYCVSSEYAVLVTVPTRDNKSCRVYRCRAYSNDE